MSQPLFAVTGGIDPVSLNALQVLFRALGTNLKDHVRRAVVKTTYDAHAVAVKKAPVHSGTLKQSIGEPIIAADGLTGRVVASAKYAGAVEYGSRPHMPPVAPLVRYMKLRYGLSDEDAKRAGWGLAMAIKKRGTRAQPFMRPAYEQAQRDFYGNVEKALKNAIREVVNG